MTALDLASDNFAVIVDASTQAKFGRMGADEFCFLSSFVFDAARKKDPGNEPI